MKNFEQRNFERKLRKLSMTKRFCYLFLCIETYLITCYPEKDWTPVAKRCWQWTKDYWNKGWDIYSMVVPEFLFEFDSYEKVNKLNFDGMLSEKDYRELIDLFAGLTTGNTEDEINQVLMLPIEFSNECEGADLVYASNATMWVFHEMQRFLSLHNIPLPDMSRIKNITGSKYGWGDFVDSEYLSIIIK